MTPLSLQSYLSQDRPTRLNRSVRSAKEAFLSNQPDVALRLARPVIVRSWQEARTQGLDPHADRAPTGLDAAELERLLEAEMLGRIGRQVLDQYDDLVATTNHVIVLADERGHILYSVGHDPLRDELDRVNFRPGGVWSVAEVGPNGIGTVLELGQPEMVFGHEHFCAGWSPWVCYGAPIMNPETGRLLGVVDITGPADAARLEGMGLTISIASAIERELELDAFKRRERLRDRTRELERRWPEEALIQLSSQGVIVDANPRASELFDLAGGVTAHAELAAVLPEVWQALGDSVRLGERAELDLDVGDDDEAVRIRVEPALEGREVLGAALVCSPRRRPPAVLGLPRGTATTRYGFEDIAGTSPALARAIECARTAAVRAPDDPVLIEGETGTGKELFAHAIHRESARRHGPFIVLNCGALPRDLAESELFGYATGAFTGAKRQGHAGCFEQAAAGTLFLDEIDSLPVDLQVKFLRVVETGEVTRIGEHTPRAVDVRIIAAAGHLLAPLVDEGRFRRDLYHRLNVVGIELPPLRARDGDVALLTDRFLAEAAVRYRRDPPLVTAEARMALAAYGWPGNIRELMNLCRRLVLNAPDGVIDVADLPSAVIGPRAVTASEVRDLRDVTDQAIEDAVARNGGNVQAAARELGISRATIYRRRKGR